MMNHDATHCADYTTACPKGCYRAQLTAEDYLHVANVMGQLQRIEGVPEVAAASKGGTL